MKHRNKVFPATLVALAFALAPVVQAGPRLDGGPVSLRATPTPRARPTPAPRPNSGLVSLAANEGTGANTEASSAYPVSAEGERMLVITIHSIDNVTRGKTGSFVLEMKPALMLGGLYVNFSVSGTAVPTVDYVALVSPAYIGQSGYGLIQVQTLPDPRGSSLRQAYSVVITLGDGAGYSVGKPSSATMWIKP
jgi:hypothetical protein